MPYVTGITPPAPIKYDGSADALYYTLTSEKVARTIDIGGRVMVDVDADGEAVGVEILNPPGFSMSIAPVAAVDH